jgi:hypothetical protein
MARRRIGQEVFRFGGETGGGASALDELARLIDWPEIDGPLVDICAVSRGEAARPLPDREDLRHLEAQLGLRRMRWMGRAKATLQVRLAAIAYNLKRSATLRRSQQALDRGRTPSTDSPSTR